MAKQYISVWMILTHYMHVYTNKQNYTKKVRFNIKSTD